MVGMVVTISPSFNLYRMVVLPAASRPTCTHAQSSSYAFEAAGERTINIPGYWGGSED